MVRDDSRVRVLVVDDDEDARELVAYVLKARGIEVLSAPSVEDALAKLEILSPHVVVSDIGMPDRDGYSLIRSIRMHPVEALKCIPAIALTAFTSLADRTRALREGFTLHMAKPVELHALVTAVTELAERKQHVHRA